MYGYFRPKSSQLTPDEQRLFHAYYCRVCYCLRLLGGQPARLFTTFDMAVYSLLLNTALKTPRPAYHRCEKFGTAVMHEFDGDELGKRLAEMSVILFGEKIRDDRLDGNNLRAGGMDLMYRRTVDRARAAEPEMTRIAREGTDRINRLQNEGADLHEILGAYGDMVADLFRCIGELDEKLARAIRSIAVWTFYIDLLCDYDKDYRDGAYNGFRAEGQKTLKAYFDANYLTLIGRNAEVTGEIREALMAANDGSPEWRIVYKIVDTALGNTIPLLLATRKEKLAMAVRQTADRMNCRVPRIMRKV